MKKQANILDPTLTAILERNGVKLASAPPVGTEPPMHDGGHVDPEFAISDEDTGSAQPKGPLTHEDNKLLTQYLEGGMGVADWENQSHAGKVPAGEQPSFGGMLSGQGERPKYTKTTTDPGYHDSKPDSEFSTGGKEAEFLESLNKLAEVQNNFFEDIAFITKLAAGEGMDPNGAVQGMLGQGTGAPEEGEEGGEELSPEELAAAQNVMQQSDLGGGEGLEGGLEGGGEGEEGGDEELTPEEVELVQQILQEHEAGGGGEDAGLEGEGLEGEGLEGGEEDEELTPEELQLVMQILQQHEAGGGGEEEGAPVAEDLAAGKEASYSEEDGEELSNEELQYAGEILKVAETLVNGAQNNSGVQQAADGLSQEEIDYAADIVDAAEKYASDKSYTAPANAVYEEVPVMEKIAKLQAKNANQAGRAQRYSRTINDLIGKNQ